MKDLEQKIIEARAAYYNGTPCMADAEYDALEDALRARDPNHPLLALVGAPTAAATGWAKVTHGIPMGSQNKAQTGDEVRSWAGTHKDFCVTDKLDGLSIALKYQDRALVQALTRGDGETGEDITVNVKLMQGVPKILPPRIAGAPTPSVVFVRGEIVIEKKTHLEKFPGEANPRNSAAGTAKRRTGNERCQYLQVRAYQLLGSPPQAKVDEIQTLKDMGFLTPSCFLLDLPGTLALYERYCATARAALPYEIDGLIIEVNDRGVRESWGELNGRPRGSIAFKFPHDQKPTKLKNVVWQVGNSGRVTPVAIFEPVGLAGATVEQATLHNVGYIETITEGRGLRVGDEILVTRRNDVIPGVESLLVASSGTALSTPKQCPSCNSALTFDGAYLVCTSDECDAQATGALKRWINKIGVLHFGDSLIQAITEAYPFCLKPKEFEAMFDGVKMEEVHTLPPEDLEAIKATRLKIPDLYRLDENAVASLESGGRRMGGSAIKALANLRAKMQLPLSTIVGSLGIPLVGRETAKTLYDAGYTTMALLSQGRVTKPVTLTDGRVLPPLGEIPGVGEARARSFTEGWKTKVSMVLDLLTLGVSIAEPTEVVGGLTGKSFCMTGFRDPQLSDALEAHGATIKSGVSKNLTYLIAADPKSNSGKAKQARDYGVQVIGVTEAWDLVGGRG